MLIFPSHPSAWPVVFLQYILIKVVLRLHRRPTIQPLLLPLFPPTPYPSLPQRLPGMLLSAPVSPPPSSTPLPATWRKEALNSNHTLDPQEPQIGGYEERRPAGGEGRGGGVIHYSGLWLRASPVFRFICLHFSTKERQGVRGLSKH